MVTAELAVGMVAFAIIAVSVFWAIGAVVRLVQCSDVAAQVARQEARGDHTSAARVAGAAEGVRVVVQTDGRVVAVRASAASARIGLLPPVPVHAEATAALEPGDAPR